MAKIAFCGLDCEKCNAFTATQTNDDALREKTAKRWSELNGILIEKDMINCDGCCENGKKTVFCESLCEIRKCVLQSGFSSCGKCRELKKCDKIKMIISNNKEALLNLSEK